MKSTDEPEGRHEIFSQYIDVTYSLDTQTALAMLKGNAMAEKVNPTLKVALENTPIEQAVDTFFIWLEGVTMAKITNPVVQAFAIEGLKVANQLIDMVLAKYNI